MKKIIAAWGVNIEGVKQHVEDKQELEYFKISIIDTLIVYSAGVQNENDHLGNSRKGSSGIRIFARQTNLQFTIFCNQ